MTNLTTHPENNRTSLRVPRKYQHMVESIHHEECDGKRDYWLYTAKGYYSPEMECGTIHEFTQRDVLAYLRNVRACAEPTAAFPNDGQSYCYCGHQCLD